MYGFSHGETKMKVTPTPLDGVMLVELVVHGDQRGFFTERYNLAKFEAAGLPTIYKQDNHSRSAPGVLRGLHFQTEPPQGKLVGVVRGRIWDVAVDIRPESKSYGWHYGVELTAENGKMLWIPGGFAHGFCVLGNEPADVLYKVTSLYNPATEAGILWNDKELGVPWPITKPTVSARDEKLQTFEQYRTNPFKWN